MTALNEFESALIGLIGRPSKLRPFVCDGSPLDCSVLIVGANAATEMSEDFWKFWNPNYGFNKMAWFQAYLQERQLRPLKPGKTKRMLVSPTRRVIGWITEEAMPTRILETNVFSIPTGTLAE